MTSHTVWHLSHKVCHVSHKKCHVTHVWSLVQEAEREAGGEDYGAVQEDGELYAKEERYMANWLLK